MPAHADRPFARTRVFIAAFAALAGAAGATAAWSQTVVWRCDDGGVSRYAAQPCDTGRPVDVADPRSAEQVRQGLDVAERERRLLATLVAERAQRERAPTPGAAGIGTSQRTPQAGKDARHVERRHPKHPGEASGRANGRLPSGGAVRPARPAA